ncbi:hypothetical protein Xen7305DRAFT_00005020 [Xenococcus sp. PCC 7305]|nr:hypothetical protein Xen7305DRAFT_00005020 [Xenococcus sp. PCC 7305]
MQESRSFCIFDYFLDGVFLKWEEVEGNCPLLVPGEDRVVNLEDGTKITAKVVEIEGISENEKRVYLSSGTSRKPKHLWEH